MIEKRQTFAALLALTLAASGALAGCTRGRSIDELDARCEIHLDNLSHTDVDLVALTGRTSPLERCELFLLQESQGDESWTYDRVALERWSINCVDSQSGEACALDAGEGRCECAVDLDPLLELTSENGLLLCEPVEGASCPADSEGARTRCERRDDIDLGTILTTDQARNVVSVDTFESSPDLVAVTWVDGVYGATRPIVSILRQRQDVWELEEEVDVCTDCVLSDGEAPSGDYVSIQTAVSGDNLMLAGPCGSADIALVNTDGSCEAVSVVDRETLTTQPVMLAVLDTELEEAPFMTLWTNGNRVFSTLLDENLEVASEPRLHWEEYETESREHPTAVCFGESMNEQCMVMWSNITQFPSDDDEEQSSGASELQWRGLDRQGGVEWSTGRQTLGEGARGIFAVDRSDSARSELPRGVLIARNPIYGLVARSWNIIQSEEIEQPEIVWSAGGTQITGSSDAVGMNVSSFLPGTFVVSFTDLVDDSPRLRLALLSYDGEGAASVTQERDLDITAPDLLARRARPLLASHWSGGDMATMVIGFPSATSSCRYDVRAFDGASVALEEGVDIDWTARDSWSVEAEGDCASCEGDIAWLGDCAVAAIPTTNGLAISQLCPGGAVTTTFPIGTETSERPCDVALRTSDDGEALFLAYELRDGDGIRVFRGANGAEDLEWTEVELTENDGIQPRVSGTAPRFATGVNASTLLLWTDRPYGDWPQQNLRVGVIESDEESSGYTLRPVVRAGRDVADSRVAVAAATTMPCDGVNAGGDQCAFIALSRPDPVEVQEDDWYDDSTYLTPTVVGRVVNILGSDTTCSTCGGVELVDEEIWRGLPTTLIRRPAVDPFSIAEPPVAPLGAFAEVPPTLWDRGTVSAFDFNVGPTQTPDGLRDRWLANLLEPYWLIMGGDAAESDARSLRMSTQEGPTAAIWVVTSDQGSSSEDIVVFSLVDEDLEPTTRGLILDRWSSEPPAQAFPDVRWLMAEHIQADVAHLGTSTVDDADRDAQLFLAAWVSRPTAASGVPPSAHVSILECAPESIEQ